MKVLVAVDDSHFADGVADFVASQPFAENCSIHVISVVENMLVGSYMSVLPSPVISEMRDKVRASMKEKLDKVIERLAKSFAADKLSSEILEGFPADEIVEAAVRLDADLIVVGTRGRKGLNRFVMGSVSQKVLLAAPCSVMICRSKAEATSQE